MFGKIKLKHNKNFILFGMDAEMKKETQGREDATIEGY